jgi:hypothetical protein
MDSTKNNVNYTYIDVKYFIKNTSSRMHSIRTIDIRDCILNSDEEIISFFNEYMKLYMKVCENDDYIHYTRSVINDYIISQGIRYVSYETTLFRNIISVKMLIAYGCNYLVPEIVRRLSPEMKTRYTLGETDLSDNNLSHSIGINIMKLIGATDISTAIEDSTHSFFHHE